MSPGQRLLLNFFLVFLFSQGRYSSAQGDSFSSKFTEASKLSEEKENEKALSIWLELCTLHPDNGNVNYRAGVAYLNSYKLKTAALPYLQRAIDVGVNNNYDPYSPQEKKSPVEVWYYIGVAYHLAAKLDLAELAYENFMKETSQKHYLFRRAELGVNQVYNARVLMAEPLEFDVMNLGEVINTQYPEYSPVITIDENAIFFTSKRPRADSTNFTLRDARTGDYFEDIYVSYKNRKGEWQSPELLEINTLNHTATVNVSIDGQVLYMYEDIKGSGTLFESKLVGEKWSTPKKLNGDVNSDYWEPHIAVSADGQMAYFVSNRPGGLGGRDIYLTRMLPNGEWGKAQNLGPGINTAYEEDAVFISPDGKALYFSSEGHTSMGGFDVFYSAIDDEGTWSVPKNLGYPINSLDDDIFFVTSADGKRAYYSSFKPEGYGQKDLYMINLPLPRELKLAVLKGLIVNPGGKLPENLKVSIINRDTQEAGTYTPRKRDGNFVAILPPCNRYDVSYQIDGIEVAVDTFSLECNVAYQEIYKELLLNPVIIFDDGTARVVTDGSTPVFTSISTVASSAPLQFKRLFGYNQNKVAEEDIFTTFAKGLKARIETIGMVEVQIVGSASKVPTRTYKTNQNLAQIRAENGKQELLDRLTALGADTSKIKFTEVVGKVQGPDYNGDASNQSQYKPFQYLEITTN